MASRVFPVPPGPVSVTSRASSSSLATRFSSSSRPTKLVSCAGRLEARGVPRSAATCAGEARPAAGGCSPSPRSARSGDRGVPGGRPPGIAPRKIARWMSDNAGDGSTPSWSASSCRVSWYTFSASPCRPARYSARMSWPRSRSRSGYAAASSSSSGARPAPRPSARSASIRSSVAASRSSSSRATGRAANESVGHLGQRRAAPQPQRAAQHGCPVLRVTGRQRAAGHADQPLELRRVHLLRRHGQLIPARPVPDSLGPAAWRSRETSAWRALPLSAGPSAGHRSAHRRSAEMVCPASRASRISKARSRGPPSSMGCPASPRTWSGPRMPTCTCPLSPEPGSGCSYQGSTPSCSASPSAHRWPHSWPVGPSAGSVARCTQTAAPCTRGAEPGVPVQVGRAVARVGRVHLDRGAGQFLGVHGGDHVQRGLGRGIGHRRHRPQRAVRVQHRADGAHLAGHVDDARGRGAAEQREHGVGHGDHAEHVGLEDLAQRVQGGLAGRPGCPPGG